MPETGRVAVFQRAGEPMVIREFEAPEPRHGALLVRLSQTNICGSDLHVWRGDTPLGTQFTIETVLGHEMVGTVARLGKGRGKDALGATLKEGDRIVFTYYKSCGACQACLGGLMHACETSLVTVFKPISAKNAFVGGFGDYYMVSSKQTVLKVPDVLTDDEVAGANCALSQVIFGLLEANLRFGETVVIQGAGGLGLYATAVAREMGAHQIIVIDGVQSRLELAKQMGADEVIDIREHPDGKSRVKRVKKLTGRWGADLVIEVVGIPEVMPEGVRMMARTGRYLTLGNISPRKTYKEDPSILVGGNRSIIGRSLYPPIILKRALDFLVRGRERFPFASVSQRYPLEQINQAFTEAETFASDTSGVTRATITMN
jgi:D-arabinose 1-dehydrogenase-like Zn-dependent alcohol dehydrogenase